MNDQVEVIEDDNDEVTEDFNPVESKAMEGGWRPEGEWEGDPDSWVDAKTFNMRGELMDRIKSQTSQLKGQDKKLAKLENAMQNLAEHNKKVDELAYKKALTDLKDLKRNAHEMSDYEQVVEIDDKIAELKDTQKEDIAVDEPQTNEPNPEIVSWIETNDWYKTDTVLRGAADAIADELYNQNKGSDVGAILDMVTDRMKKEFPHKFGGASKTPSHTVNEPGKANTKAKSAPRNKYTQRHLNPQQREMVTNWMDSGLDSIMSVQDYVNQLAEMGELDAQRGI